MIVSLNLTSLIPMSSNVLIAEPPLFSIFLSPPIKSVIAPVASVLNFSLNWSADIPATLANCSSASPPVSVATSMLIISLLKAVPPLSLAIPNEDKVAANPKISASDIPICEPAAASPKAMFIISASVVAVLLPKSTRELPNLSTVPVPLPVIFKNLASAVDASSLDKLVVSPNITAVFVNVSRLPTPLIPSCPAISITCAISSALSGISLDIFLTASLSCLNSGSVASTVFLTPAKAS